MDRTSTSSACTVHPLTHVEPSAVTNGLHGYALSRRRKILPAAPSMMIRLHHVWSCGGMMDPVGYDPVLDADDDWLIIHVLYHELLTLIIFDILQNKVQ